MTDARIAQLVEQGAFNSQVAGSSPAPGIIARNWKAKGDVAEAYVTARLLESGRNVLKPLGDNCRYDLVMEDVHGFHRVQVKSGYRDGHGCIKFATSSSSFHAGGKRMSYRGQIEFFACFDPETHAVYLVPVNDVGTAFASLRLEPTRNGQKRGCRMAEDYKV